MSLLLFVDVVCLLLFLVNRSCQCLGCLSEMGSRVVSCCCEGDCNDRSGATAVTIGFRGSCRSIGRIDHCGDGNGLPWYVTAIDYSNTLTRKSPISIVVNATLSKVESMEVGEGLVCGRALAGHDFVRS